jgi:hypothetical protein
MRISELREFINKIPKSMDDFQIVYRKFEDEGENVILLDYPLVTLYVDEESQESVFLDEDGWYYFKTNLLLLDEDGESDEYDKNE